MKIILPKRAKHPFKAIAKAKDLFYFLLLFVMIFAFTNFSNAQNQQSSHPEVTQYLPKSPEAANLGKYFDFPVGTSTGVPSINIPLFNLSYGKIQLPISLNYHSGGVKVDDIASEVGTGWTLATGGTIMRIDRGLPDKISSNFDYNKINDYVDGSMTEAAQDDYFLRIYQQIDDPEPDIYHFNVANIQGSFFEVGNGEFVTIPRDLGVKVEKYNTYNWKLTDKSGNKYLFTHAEHNENVYDVYSSATGLNTSGPKNSISLWNISKIEDFVGNEILFDYLSSTSTVTSKPIEKVEIYPLGFYTYGHVNKTATVITTVNSGWKLNKITFGNKEIKLNYSSTERLDYNSKYALENIEIKNNGNPVKKINFFTSYFLNNDQGTNNTPAYYTYQTTDMYRLRLDSIKEEGSNPYIFEYYFNNGLPYRLSNAQDHWGFYNGQNNTSFINYVDINGFPVGPNKEVNPAFVSECTLKKIIYPTKGYKQFEYESNTTYMTVSNLRDTTIQVADLSGSTSERTFNEGYLFADTIQIDQNGFHGTYHFSHDNIPQTFDYTFSGTIKKLDNSFEQMLFSGTHGIVLPSAGSYVIIGEIIDNTFDPLYPKNLGFSITLMKKESLQSQVNDNFYGPGLRIKKIINNYEPENNQVRIYDYNTPNSTQSSGILTNTINFDVYRTSKTLLAYMVDPDVNALQIYDEYSSVPNYALSPIGATYISYSYVTEYFDEQKALGKNVTKFTNLVDFEDVLNSTFIDYPFVPTPPIQFKIGLPLLRETYSFENNIYSIKERKILKYQTLSGLDISRKAIKVGFPYTSAFAVAPSIWMLSVKIPYELKTEVFKLISDTTYQYSNSAAIGVVNTYQYSPVNFEMIALAKENSNGSTTIIKTKYPHDHVQSNNDLNGVYSTMLSKNMIANVVETETSTNGTPTARVKYNYDFFNLPAGNFINLKEIKKWNHVLNSDDLELKIEKYNKHGYPVQWSDRNNYITTLIYSYDEQYPVVKVVGSDYTTVSNIVSQASIDAATNTTGNDAGVRSLLQNIRSHFAADKTVQVSTYTYKPLVGMTSETDPTGRTIYYEYDSFNRLKLQKDEQGNILKKYCYNYAGQPIDCN